ncbi:MAG: Hpt domain-containing protein [Ruminococcus sp.]|nr:Hpt domain-containing protein [Ruminococcus sp.]
MGLEQFYEHIGGELDEVRQRLIKDERIEKYVVRFAQSDDRPQLCSLLEQKDYKGAFMRAHDIKGTSATLGFPAVYSCASLLCDALRGGEPCEDISPLVEQLGSECDKVAAAVSEFIQAK